jgi:hypothetical protein
MKLHYDISTQAIAMAFSRGAGIVCKDKQCEIDLIVPVLLDDRKESWEAGPKLPVVRLPERLPIGPNTAEEKTFDKLFSPPHTRSK